VAVKAKNVWGGGLEGTLPIGAHGAGKFTSSVSDQKENFEQQDSGCWHGGTKKLGIDLGGEGPRSM